MQWKSAFRAASLASVAFAGGAAAMPSPAAAQTQVAIDYDLPSQDLGDTLRAIARVSGREILFASNDVKGRKAPAIKGRYSLDEALRSALSGTGLIVEYRAGAVVVREHASVRGEEPSAAGTPASITVTGTRIRGAGSASPVTVTTRRELEQAGISDLADFSRILPQNYTGGQNRGVAGGGEQGGQLNLNDSVALNLRGLGPDATLTLLNGHRLSYDAVDQGVDISAIPLAAIDRIEVVSDGASALYGSDAVAGVANIILRRDYQGLETTARVGGSTDGGNFQRQFSLVGGKRWSSGGFMLALDNSLSTPITAGERDYTKSLDPSFFLTDRIRQSSGVLSLHQQIARNLELDLDGYATARASRLQDPFLPDVSVLVAGIVSENRVRSYALTPTLRADVGRWQASLSMTRAKSRTSLDFSNYWNGIPRTGHNLFADTLSGVEATAEGPLLSLPGGDARLAFGGGLRNISLRLNETIASGGQSFTTANSRQSRNVQFAYGELSLPLVRPDLALPLLNRLTLSAALRYEHWNRIASVTTPKLGVIYQPIADVTVRGTWGESFKIPTLIQVNQIQEGDLIPGFYFTPAPQPDGSPVLVVNGSAPNLKPEHATTWSATFELAPRSLAGLHLQATYFHVDYRDRIAEPIASVLTAIGNPLYSNLITYNPSAAVVNGVIATLPGGLVNETGAPFDPAAVGAIIDASIRNTARQRIHGVDLSGDYRFDLGTGRRLLLTGSASYLASNQQLAAGQPLVAMAGTIFNPPHWGGRGGEGF